MANKPKTPTPPRRVQATPQRTVTPAESRARYILFGSAALGIVGLIAAVSLWAFAGDGGDGGDGGGTASAVAALNRAGCRLQEFPAMRSREHVETPPKYSTSPPTSGRHYPAPAPWDVYPEPVEQFRLVHNLEHGGVVIQYGPGAPANDVSRFIAWYRDDPNGIVITPLPTLGQRYTLRAWTSPPDPESNGVGRAFLATCPRFDRDAFEQFKQAYGFRGPERFPREQLVPGA